MIFVKIPRILLARVLVTVTGFGLVTGLINRLQVVTTITCKTFPDLRNLQSFTIIFSVYFHLSSLSISWHQISTQELSHPQSSNVTHKSVLLTTRQFLAD
jgi:hypothetical protein